MVSFKIMLKTYFHRKIDEFEVRSFKKLGLHIMSLYLTSVSANLTP